MIVLFPTLVLNRPPVPQRDPRLRQPALEVLLAHPYAADDLLSSPAWQPFCTVLPSLLSDACTETAAAAASFARSIFREVKMSSPQQLAQLCIALAASVTCVDNACTACNPSCLPGRSSHVASDAALHASSSVDTASLDRAALQAAVMKLLAAALEALPKVWASFRPPLLQQLWDTVCALLRSEAGSHSAPSAEPIAAEAPAHAKQAEAVCGHLRGAAAGTKAAVQLPQPGRKAQTACSSGRAQACQHRGSAGASSASQPLAALCHADEGNGRWWRLWTAPAASAKVVILYLSTLQANTPYSAQDALFVVAGT